MILFIIKSNNTLFSLLIKLIHYHISISFIFWYDNLYLFIIKNLFLIF